MPDAREPGYCVSSNPLNPPCTANVQANGEMMFARSRHTDGLNAALADGSVRFVINSINLGTWQALGTARGGEPLGDF